MIRFAFILFILFLASCALFSWLSTKYLWSLNHVMGSAFTWAHVLAGGLFLIGFSLYVRKK